MTHEKIIKREDGTRVCIQLTLIADFREVSWRVNISVCQPKKRTFKGIYSSDDYLFRRMEHEEKKYFIESKQLEYVTPAEILFAKLELWNKFKPV